MGCRIFSLGRQESGDSKMLAKEALAEIEEIVSNRLACTTSK
jgi:hypothetical protein